MVKKTETKATKVAKVSKKKACPEMGVAGDKDAKVMAWRKKNWSKKDYAIRYGKFERKQANNFKAGNYDL